MRFFIIICFLLLSSVQSFSQKAMIEPALIRAFEQSEKTEYIVWMKDRKVFNQSLPNLTKEQKAALVYRQLVDKAVSAQSDILRFLQYKKVAYQSFYVTNAIKVTSDITTMLWIADRPEVEWIFYNQPIKMLDYEEDKSIASLRNIDPEWGIKMIQADSVWALGFNGKNVVIGGQDTGYAWDVSPLKNKYRGYVDSTVTNHDYNWHDAIHERNPAYPDSLINPCGFNATQPCDDNNHGTHTMGTMVGEDDENKIGVAPGARWIGCRNMDRGWGKPSTYLECFEWFLAPYDLNGENADPSKAPHVINNSWYCSEAEGCNLSNFYLMNDAVTNLKASGVVVVVSAGNSGRECGSVSGPPAIFENSFSIGATTDVDTIARFSSRGLVVIDSSFRTKPNVSAPGARVRSVIRDGSFANFSGTSMAGPHAAGLVALIISANPNLAGNVDAIEDIIESTADFKVGPQDCNNVSGESRPNAVYGYGRINAFEAVKKALDFSSQNNETVDNGLISIFPNPTADNITFVTDQKAGKILSVEVFGRQGSLTLQDNVTPDNVLFLPVNTLSSGMYLYKVVTDTGRTFTGKFTRL